MPQYRILKNRGSQFSIDRSMVLASDGLWDVVSEDKVLELIHEGNTDSELLAEYALDNGSEDNVTVITCDFASLLVK